MDVTLETHRILDSLTPARAGKRANGAGRCGYGGG
jgi:hypothetical protein